MTTKIREHLHQQIDHLPDEIVQRLADLVSLMTTEDSLYADWDEQTWQEFVLTHFFRDEDEVEYTLADAKEIYHP